MAMIFITLDKSSIEYKILEGYFKDLEASENYQGHIITTHMNMLLMKDKVIQTHQIIIDEDILKANKSKIFNSNEKNYLVNLCNKLGYQICEGYKYVLTESDYQKLEGVQSNVVDLFQAKYLYIGNDIIYYIKQLELPKTKLIVMSATAEPLIYQSFLHNRRIITHECKKAKYMGNVVQYTNSSYSRDFLSNNNEIIGGY